MKKIYIVIILLASCVFKPNNSNAYSNKTNVQDSLALVDLYNSTYGPLWLRHDNWFTKPVSSWYGVLITKSSPKDTVDRRVVQINLPANNLQGVFPASLSNLTQLNTLNLQYNLLVGGISFALDSLKKLRYLYLNNNLLNGSITVFDSLPAMFHLDLSNNRFIGSLTSSFRYVPILYNLNLNNNLISGSIPASLCDTNLHYLYLSHNKLTGSIPKELGNTKLFNLDLSFNMLSGKIPKEIGNTKKIDTLYLNNNQLSDTIPGSLGTITALSTLDLSHNQLTGNIPELILTRKVIISLYLDYNQLSGSIPNVFNYGSMLQNLYLNQNNFTGAIPKSIGNLIYLKYLFLAHNDFTGIIPDTLRSLKILRKLELADNEFKGALPSFLNDFWYLDTINIERNHFTFAGLEPLVQHNFNSFLYDNQRTIFIHQHSNYLAVNAGGTLSKNTYKWYNGSTLVATINGDSTYTPTVSGVYSVQVTNSVCTQLTLYSSDYIFTLSALQQQSISLIQANTKTNFSIYPNPAHDFINVYFSNIKTDAEINVYDVNSKRLITQKTGLQKATNININITMLAAGTYFIETITDNKIIKQKFVKQ